MQEDDLPSRGGTDRSASEEESSSYVLSSDGEDGSTSWSDVASDTSSFEASCGKKRRKIGARLPPPRPDNVQTRKLRPPQHLRQNKPDVPKKPTVTPVSSPEPEIVRQLTEDDVQRDMAVVTRMWEMSSVFHFFQAFQERLQLTNERPKMDEVEQAIVKSNGHGLLARLHIDLIKGFKPRLGADESNWQAVLARKLRSECPDLRENPFNPERGNEALAYCNAPVKDRVLALKLLCDFRCCENDTREIFDFHLKPGPKDIPQRKKTVHKKDASIMNTLRNEPLGQTNAGTFCWFLEATNLVDFRLYKETRENVRRRDHGRLRVQTRIKSWELIAKSVEQLVQFGEELSVAGTHSRSLKKKILEELVPRLEKRIEREDRRLKAVEKMRRLECNIILDDNGGYGRSARVRNDAKYTFEEYERAMAEAIDDGMVISEKEEDGRYADELECVHDAMTFVDEVSHRGDDDIQDGDPAFPNPATTAFNAASGSRDSQL